MNLSYLKISIAACFPIIASLVFSLIDRKSEADTKKKKALRQIIIGVVFGCIAIIGTEWGIPLADAQINCRDAAPLCAGLFFGGPAGIIAGLIGGLERWIAVAWGVGRYTRLACSVSTALAGLYAAFLRKALFDNKRPSWTMALASGIVMEVFHLTMVFVTNIKDAERAFHVVQTCSATMIIANGLSVMFAAIVISLLSHEELFSHRLPHISESVQRAMLICVAIAFVITSAFMNLLLGGIVDNDVKVTLETALNDISRDIMDISDENLLVVSRHIAEIAVDYDLRELAAAYGVSEISMMDDRGVIYRSTRGDYLGFNMNSGEQSKAFLCLLDGEDEYVQAYGPISKDSLTWMKYAGIATDYGFIQVGYNEDTFSSILRDNIISSTKNRTVGKAGFSVVTDPDWYIISAGGNHSGVCIRSEDLGYATKAAEAGEVYTANAWGTEYYCMKAYSEGYNIISMLPKSEALLSKNVSMYANVFMQILVYGLLFVWIFFIIKNTVVKNIISVNKSLGAITEGDLDEVVSVRSNQEFNLLSDDINHTVDSLKGYIGQIQDKIAAEMEFAKSIQYSALPNRFPPFPGRNDFDIYASMRTAKEVGGDFYDFYLTNRDSLNFLIADVSGKGVPAALFMMRSKVQLKSLIESGVPLNEAVTTANHELCEGNGANMFVTAWQGQINLETGLVSFVNAGHNLPLVKHAGGQFEYLKSRAGFVLAGMDGVKYRLQQLQLQKGDIIYLYTDGVTEATDSFNELYGETRLQSILNSREFGSMEELCKTVQENVDAFVGAADQFDDITMLAIRFTGKERLRFDYERAEISNITEITQGVEEKLEEYEAPMKAVMQLSIAIDELYSNIVNYAYGDGFGNASVVLEKLNEKRGVSITFMDSGVPYNPLTRNDPDVTLSVEERGVGGLGIYMVKNSMDDMAYEYKDGQNRTTIYKYF